jgi:hypothetical protein
MARAQISSNLRFNVKVPRATWRNGLLGEIRLLRDGRAGFRALTEMVVLMNEPKMSMIRIVAATAGAFP